MKKILFIGASILLLACSPLDRKANKETINKDIEDILASRDSDYDSSDYFNFESQIFVMNAHLTNNKAFTYRQIIEGIKDERLKYEAKLKSYEDSVSLIRNKIVNGTITNRTYDKGTFKSYISFVVKLDNLSDKEIKIVKYKIFVSPKSNSFEKGYQFEDYKTIAPGNSIVTINSYLYDESSNDDKAVLNTDLKELNIQFIPEAITFSDGTVIELPEKPIL